MDPRCHKPRLTGSLDGRLVKSNLRWERSYSIQELSLLVDHHGTRHYIFQGDSVSLKHISLMMGQISITMAGSSWLSTSLPKTISILLS